VNTIDYGRGRVKLGITAPTDVNVIREELEPFDQVKVSTEVEHGKRD
jgi:sRNA-binding carbon storage regulator CsrA